jgi:type II secretory pathway component PulC
MAINYSSLRATAERLIRENGRDIQVVRRSRTAADPTKPGRASETTTTSITVKGVILFADLEQVDNVTIEREDQLAFISAEAVENINATVLLEEYDYVVDGGVQWDIINKNVIEPGVPGESRVLYTLQLRK